MSHIRLCMIVHNEAKSIRATLESVKHTIDSWAILDNDYEGIGSTDGTRDIIDEVLGDIPGQLFVAPFVKYMDAFRSDGTTYPVIDYAETRNLLLDLQDLEKADFLLWLDGGDSLHEENRYDLRLFCDRAISLRPSPAPGPYTITMEITPWPTWPGVRFMRANCGARYRQPVHEALCDDVNPRGEIPSTVRIVHVCDDLSRQAPRWWNDTKVLTRYLEEHPNDPRGTFYLAQSWECLNEFGKARDLYFEAGTSFDLGCNKYSKYEAFLRSAVNGERSGEPWVRTMDRYLCALDSEPGSAEPLCSIASRYAADGNIPRSRMFARMGLQVSGGGKNIPSGIPFDREVYTWKLRVLAGQNRPPSRGPSTKPIKFSLIHPTRGRVQKALETYKRLTESFGGYLNSTIEYIFSLDVDDYESMKADWPVGSLRAFGMSKGSVDAYNRGWELATGDVIIQVQDDVDPPPFWDVLIANSIGDTSIPRLLQVSDGTGLNRHKPWLLTVLIGTQAYFRKCGYMYHPDYRHCYADDDHGIKGIFENCVIGATDIVFKHNWEGSDSDDTARRNYGSESMNLGVDVFRRRAEQGFPDV